MAAHGSSTRHPALVGAPELEARFEVLGSLGEGSHGQVLRARDRAGGGELALKLVPLGPGEGDRRRFREEAAALARVDHPAVVRLLDSGEGSGAGWLAMELLEGETLDRAEGLEVLPALLAVAEGLGAVHAAGLVHRDVKPRNMVHTRDGRTVLIDLGLARGGSSERLTTSGVALGSLAFMAPERLWGAEATPASDWYAWGASAYRLLEGRPPFAMEVLKSVAEGGELPPPRFAALDPSGRVAAALSACLDPVPARRPRSHAELRARLEGGGAEGPLATVPLVPAGPGPAGRGAAGAASFLLAFLAALAAVLLLRGAG